MKQIINLGHAHRFRKRVRKISLSYSRSATSKTPINKVSIHFYGLLRTFGHTDSIQYSIRMFLTWIFMIL
jgi:hypothetical protein